MANVVRQDVVQIGFEVKDNPISKLVQQMDELRKSIAGVDTDDAFSDMAKEAQEANKGVEDVKESVKGIKPAGVDDTADGFKETKEQAEKAKKPIQEIAKTGFEKAVAGAKKLGSALGKAAISAGKVLAKGVAVGAAGVGAVIGKSVMEFGDYEQLVGGVDTLFKDSSGKVQEYAKNAYKTAGLSANNYMETVTSFSASLLQSLKNDTGKASDYAHMAIVDMSDNANKMGTDMQSIQYAYQGFAKQNYTMLDNLKLGYGGTQEEMKRLVKDAAKIDKSVKANDMSFGNIVKAIHAVQTKLDITGTTAKEAATTIQGSFSSLKSAWGNTLVALVTGGDDFDKCIDNLIDSAMTFGKNIMPAIMGALEGVGKLVERLAPYIESEFPKLVDTLLPPLIKAGTALLNGFIKALPNIIKVVIKEIPNIAKQLGTAIAEAFGVKVPEGVGKGITALGGTVLALISATVIGSKVSKLFGMFGKSTEKIGGKDSGSFGNLAKMKVKDVAKGVANLAIILGGLGALLFIATKVFKSGVDMKEMLKVIGLIGVLGLVGSGLAKLAGIVGMIPVATVAKGLANIAIILAGVGALLWAATKVFSAGVNLNEMLQVITLIGILGTVGAVLSVFSGIVGTIPFPVVLAGLGNIATAIGGFSAILYAMGALTKIPGFNEFISTGGELLAKLANILGKAVGSIVGGIGEGVTNSLPKIGENLSAFATSLQPMFSAFNSVDMGGIGQFFSSFGSFMVKMAGEKLLSFFGGGSDLSKVGQQLDGFAHSAQSAFNCFSEYPESGIDKAPKILDAIKGIGSYNFKTGGLAQLFTGEVGLANIGTQLDAFAHSAQSAFNCFSEFPDSGIEKAPKIFDAISAIGKYDFKAGGLAQIGTGGVGLAFIGQQLDLFAHSAQSAFNCFSEYPDGGFEKLNAVVTALGNLSNTIGSVVIPNISGLSSEFTTMITHVTSSAVYFNALGNAMVTASTNGAAAFTSLVTNATTAMGQLVNMIRLKGNEALTAVKTMLRNITLAIANVNLSTSGSNLIQGLINGMNSKKEAAVSTARAIATAINTEFDKIQDMGSPSKVWEQKGKWLIEGGIIGMEKTMPKLQATTQRAGEMALPYTPENSITSNRTITSESNTYAPQFMLNINGSNDDRSMERKVKRWIKDSMDEVFNSMARKNPRLREV